MNEKSLKKLNNELIMACRWLDIEKVKFLVQTGANVGYIDREKRTPISVAALNGGQQIVKYLLDMGAVIKGDSKLQDQCKAVILCACMYNWIDIFKKLVEMGQDVRQKVNLDKACSHGSIDIINYFAKELHWHLTPEHLNTIALDGDIEVLEKLVKNGLANPHLISPQYEYFLHTPSLSALKDWYTAHTMREELDKDIALNDKRLSNALKIKI